MLCVVCSEGYSKCGHCLRGNWERTTDLHRPLMNFHLPPRLPNMHTPPISDPFSQIQIHRAHTTVDAYLRVFWWGGGSCFFVFSSENRIGITSVLSTCRRHDTPGASSPLTLSFPHPRRHTVRISAHHPPINHHRPPLLPCIVQDTHYEQARDPIDGPDTELRRTHARTYTIPECYARTRTHPRLYM